MVKTSGKQGILDAIQGYYGTALLLQFHRLGILHKLASPSSAKTIAKEHGINVTVTEQVLEFLARTTDVIEQMRDGRFRLGSTPRIELSFQLEKFAGAYGPTVYALGDMTRKGGDGKARVDQHALAVAFIETRNFLSPYIPELIGQSGVNCLLDLGCGTASMLIELGKRNKNFQGIGVDANQTMCRFARKAIREESLSHRIKIKHADGRDLRNCLSAAQRKQVEALHGRSFLNEFFAAGDRDVIEVLRRLRTLFHGRIAWFVDYYGELGQRVRPRSDCQLTLLQDVVQSLSGQGVPPPDIRSWRRIYRKAGCQLRREHEFQGPGIRWFIHEVEL